MNESKNIKKLTDESFQKETAHGLVLVDFYADWCGPCRMLAPVLEQVARDMSGKATVAKVDIDHSQAIASQFQIASIPTLILFKNGKEVQRVVGVRSADVLKQLIQTA